MTANKTLLPFVIALLYTGNILYGQPDDSVRYVSDTTLYINAVNVEAYPLNGSLMAIPGGLSTVDAGLINSADETGYLRAFSILPGVNMHSGTFTTNRIIIRGIGSRTPYNTNRIRTYLNDFPLTSADGLSSPEEIDPLFIRRIEIIKGPSSALYGSGLGGSLNMYAPSSGKNETYFKMQGGSFNTWKANAGNAIKKDKIDLHTSVSYLYSNGYRDNNVYNRLSALSNGNLQTSPGTFSTLLLLTYVNSGIPSSLGKTKFEKEPRSAAANWKASAGYKKYFRLISGISLQSIISGNISNKLSVYYKLYDAYERRPFNNLNDLSSVTGLKNKLSIHGNKTDFVLGGEWYLENYKWTLDTSNVLLNHNRETRKSFSLFAVIYYRPSAKATLSLAGAINSVHYLLSDRYLTNGDQSGKRSFPLIFSPRAGINYALNKTVSLYASVGHGYSLPSPEETLLPEGDVNSHIRAEQGIQFEAGGRLSVFDRRLNMDASIYHIRLKDLLTTKRITEEIFTGINAGKTVHFGIETALQYKLRRNQSFPGQTTLFLTYTRSINRFLDFTDEGINYNRKILPGVPDQMFNFQLIWKPAEFLVFIPNVSYTGKQYLDDGNTLSQKGYLLADIKVSGEFKNVHKKIFTLSGGVNNIFNEHYASMLIVNAKGFNGAEPRYYYPGPPRNAYLSMMILF